MRIRKVIAPAFGPLVDASLELGPGLNVLHGPNEAGKSSWHAALFAGICGLQRGNARKKEKARFAEAHKPWDLGRWVVGAEVELADGRVIELRHDLDGSVDCTAKDVALGRDYANEIMFEGAPDGAVWLGLNRRSFPVTACVRQAELLTVVEDPNLLQEHLQRAAATGGTDSTAAKALAAIEAFLRENVGLDRVNSTKPLRRAIERLRLAENRLDEATYEHDAYIELLARAESLDRQASETEHELRIVEAAWALEKARRWEKRLEEARELIALYPKAPPSPFEDDSLAREVAGALEAWESAPEDGSLIGPTSEELRAQIDALPEMPEGELRADAEIVRARDELVLIRRERERHAAKEPRVTQVDVRARPQDLAAMARDLEVAVPEVDPVLEEDLKKAQAAVTARSRKRAPLAIAALLAAIGAGAFIVGSASVGVVLIAGALVSLTYAVFPSRPSGEALRRVNEARATLEIARRHRAEAEAIRERAVERAGRLGLAPQAEALRSAVDAIDRAERSGRERRAWASEAERLLGDEATLLERLQVALEQRGVEIVGDVVDVVGTYEEACARRAEMAADARRRETLQDQLEVQRRAEAKVAADAGRRAEALARLRDVARKVPAIDHSGEPADVVLSLRRWELDREDALAARTAAWEEWGRLQRLLDGKNLEELEHLVADRARSAAELATGLDPYELGSVELRADVKDQVALLRATANARRREGDTARGEVEQARKSLLSVAEAEEEIAGARADLVRVQELQATLERTRGFLEAAQDSVHRDIAPRLAASVRTWLPNITDGRYSDVRVDPENLRVEVLDGTGVWRDAILLSHGTKEQIYLLLRVGLAEHLTKPGEVAPLILDDVTVQFDSRRKRAVLEMLRELSTTHQIILFTQEDEVVEWAGTNLSEPSDRLVCLEEQVAS